VLSLTIIRGNNTEDFRLKGRYVCIGEEMDCGSCGAMIPDDSIFCPECGSRQEMSRAGSFSAIGSTSLGGGEVTGGRGFGVVSGEAVRQQRETQQQGMPQGIPADVLQQIASGIHQQSNLPPGSQIPPQQTSQFPNQMSNQFPQGQQFGQNQPGQVPQNQRSDIPSLPRGPTLGSGALPTSNVEPQQGGTTVSNNPAASPTDAMVNRLAETERAVKNERRSQWLNMNQSSATNVLANLGADLPSHLKDAQGITPAAEVIAGTMGQSSSDAPNEALLRRMCEVASRRVARKRGVAVETPEAKTVDGTLVVNLTYVDDGRVLDTPEDLESAFEHAIQTEVALKGFDMDVQIVLSCMKDGQVSAIGASADSEDEEEMFACEVCDGLVKESDSKCPHCGAIFEEEEEEIQEKPSRGGPPGPSRGRPSGPKRGGGPPGSKKSGPPGGGPPGPKKGGGPPGPKKSGPPGGGPPGPKKSGGPPGPKKGGGPPGPKKGGGPPGPKKSGPPGGGPPGPKKSGPPGGGPPGPKKSGGPPKGGPSGPKRGPPR